MDTHLWVLPWLPVIVGVVTLVVSLVNFFRTPPPENPPLLTGRIPAIVTWIVLVIVAVVLELRLGSSLSVDVIGARGFLLGSVGGAGLVALCVRTVRTPSLAIFGVALTELGVARLWLTHGEMSGLTAVALATGLAVFCLNIDGLSNETSGVGEANSGLNPAVVNCVSGVVLTAILALAMQMGFTRAEQIELECWPDIPLLIASSMAVGLLISSVFRQRGTTEASRHRWARLGSVFPGLGAALMALWCSHYLISENTPLKLLAMGALCGIILRFLYRPTSYSAGSVLGTVLLFAALTLAYSYWAGYGVTLFLLGIWCVYTGVENGSDSHRNLLGLLTAGLVVAIHRGITLQNGDNFSHTDITDTWNMLAVGIGAVIPLAVTMGDYGASPKTPVNSVLSVLAPVAMLTAPVMLIAYLMATEASAALVVGVAITLVALVALRRIQTVTILSATLLTLFVLQVMPLVAGWTEPSRHVRVEVLVGVAIVAIVLSLLPRPRPVQAEA
jgi:hypothetical protein